MRHSVNKLGTLACGLSLLLVACGDGATPQRPSESNVGDDPTTASPTGSGSAGQAASGKPSAGAGEAANASAPAPIARSTRSSLQWKRYAAFEADLSQALDLPPAELCNEFGQTPCIRGVHLSPLGGHNPITTGLLESSSEPLVTTSTVVERVVLSACTARADKDRALGRQGVVFTGLDLDAPSPAPDAPLLREVINGLYRRFLARDAEPIELDTLAALARDEQGAPVPAAIFATSVCLVIGSQTEFLFF